MNPFDRHYKHAILVGLAALVAFSTFAHAAHDLWAASVVFLGVTLLVLVLCLGHFRDQKPLRFPLLPQLLFCLFALVLSRWQAFDIDAFKQDIWGWFFIVTIFYLFINAVESDEDAKLFFDWTGWLLIPLLGLCLWDQATQTPQGYGHVTIPGLHWVLSYGHWEVHATLLNSIVLAGFVLYWPIVLWQRSTRFNGFLIRFLCGIGILLLARSWWSLISLCVGFAFYYAGEINALMRRHRQIILGAAAFAILGVCGVVWFKLHQPVEGNLYFAMSRVYYWTTAIQAWRNHPWTGVGLGGYPMAFLFYKTGPVQNTLFAHSFPLQWLSETGVVGVIAAFVFAWGVVRRSFRPVSWVYLSTLVAVLLFSLISINMEYFLNQCVFMILVASALATTPGHLISIRPLWLTTIAASYLLLIPMWGSLEAASRLYTSGVYYEQQGQTAQAIRSFTDAISVDASQADSWHALSQLSWKNFLVTHSPSDLIAAHQYLDQAIRCRHDPAFFADRRAYTEAMGHLSPPTHD